MLVVGAEVELVVSTVVVLVGGAVVGPVVSTVVVLVVGAEVVLVVSTEVVLVIGTAVGLVVCTVVALDVASWEVVLVWLVTLTLEVLGTVTCVTGQPFWGSQHSTRTS